MRPERTGSSARMSSKTISGGTQSSPTIMSRLAVAIAVMLPAGGRLPRRYNRRPWAPPPHESPRLRPGWGLPQPGRAAALRWSAADAGAAGTRGRIWAASVDDPGGDADGVVVVPDRAQPGRPRHLQLRLEPEPDALAGRERGEPVRRPALARARGRGRPVRVRHDPVHISGGADRRSDGDRLRRAGAAADRAGRGAPPDRRARAGTGDGAPSHEGALVGGLRPLRAPPDRPRRRSGRGVPGLPRARARPGRARRRLYEHRLRRPSRLPPPRPDPPGARPGSGRRRARPGVSGGRSGLRRADRRGPGAVR